MKVSNSSITSTLTEVHLIICDITGCCNDHFGSVMNLRFQYMKIFDILSQGFEKIVEDTIKELKKILEDCIYDNYTLALPAAVENAPLRLRHWTQPVNKLNGALGGFHFMTFRAIVRRSGVYSNAHGLHDLNAQLCEPILRILASHWEKAFSRKMPVVLASFVRKSKSLLNTFHFEIEKRCLEKGVGIAGMSMLKNQVQMYEVAFAELAAAEREVAIEHSKEANRAFQPVITNEMQPTYDYCTSEGGSGCYARMKAHMSAHMDGNKEAMFCNSTEHVKTMLKAMVKDVELGLGEGADEAFGKIKRDYMQVVGGVRLPQGQVMSKAERTMRAAVAKILETAEEDGFQSEGQEASGSPTVKNEHKGIKEDSDDEVEKPTVDDDGADDDRNGDDLPQNGDAIDDDYSDSSG